MATVEFCVATEFNVIRVKVTPEGEKRAARLTKEGRCLACERKLVEGERVRCGQCDTCYPATLRRIKQRKITRKEVIQSGEMLAPKTAGRKPKNHYTAKLQKQAEE